MTDDVAGDEPPKPSPEAALPPVKEHPEEDDVPLEGSTADRDDAEGGQEKGVCLRRGGREGGRVVELTEEGGVILITDAGALIVSNIYCTMM